MSFFITVIFVFRYYRKYGWREIEHRDEPTNGKVLPMNGIGLRLDVSARFTVVSSRFTDPSFLHSSSSPGDRFGDRRSVNRERLTGSRSAYFRSENWAPIRTFLIPRFALNFNSEIKKNRQT